MKYLGPFSSALFEAIDYYKGIDPLLAQRFVKAIDEAKDGIVRYPKIGKQMRGFRRVMLREFPYAFCYKEDLDGELVAVILFHFKRNPLVKP